MYRTELPGRLAAVARGREIREPLLLALVPGEVPCRRPRSVRPSALTSEPTSRLDG